MPGKYLNSCHHKHLIAARYPIEITKVLNDPMMGLNNEDGTNNDQDSDEEIENIPIPTLIPEETTDIPESVSVAVNEPVEAPISDYLHGKLDLQRRLKDVLLMLGKFCHLFTFERGNEDFGNEPRRLRNCQGASQ